MLIFLFNVLIFVNFIGCLWLWLAKINGYDENTWVGKLEY